MSKIILKVIEKLISRLKHENYSFSSDVELFDLISILARRGVQCGRGIFVRTLIKGKGILFCGKKVKFFHKTHITIGSSSIIGDYSIIDALSLEGVSLGHNVTLGKNVTIKCTGVIRNIGKGVVIGNYVALGDNTIIAAQGGVVIGNDTIIGPNVLVNAENHIFSQKGIPIRLQGEERKGISIGANCWIGGNVTILDGVTIGDNCVIGAGTVVTKNVKPNSLAVGVPAKVARMIEA